MDKYIIYRIADVFFLCFHVLIVFFNLFGWIWKRLRRLNLITLGLTAFSWFILGIFYGFGYCFLTDWHWQVRKNLGYESTSDSYMHFLATTLFNLNISESLVDIFTAILFFCAIAASLATNIRDIRRKKSKHH